VSGLAGEHRDLSAVVSVVRDQISEEGGYIRTKTLNAAIALERRLQNLAECSAACFQRPLCLRGVTLDLSSCSGIFPFTAFSHITLTLCMWATMDATSRPFFPGGSARQASAGRFSRR